MLSVLSSGCCGGVTALASPSPVGLARSSLKDSHAENVLVRHMTNSFDDPGSFPESGRLVHDGESYVVSCCYDSVAVSSQVTLSALSSVLGSAVTGRPALGLLAYQRC